MSHHQQSPLDFTWAPPLYEKPIHAGRPVRVVCIGAGFSGICAAVQFPPIPDVDFQIYERADDIGGVWHQNRYPGVACDVPSHSYQYSFCEKTDWSAYYAPGSEIQQYICAVADRHDLRKYIKLEHCVTRAEWDENRSKWLLTVTNATGTTFDDEADFVLFATGLLSKPVWPDIPGRERFKGKMVHSGDWKAAELEQQPGFAWSDQRVGVIGVGASGVQIVPALQKKAKQVLNFGRSKLWLSGGYGSKMLERLQGKNGLGGNYYFTERDNAAFTCEEGYRAFRCLIEADLGSTHELSFRGHPLQDTFVDKFTEMMREKTTTKPHIGDALIPDFPVGCKRITPGPGYLKSLCCDNCDLIPDKIECFTESGIQTVDGVHHELDIIVCATGFDVSFQPVFPIIGEQGINIQDAWEKESRTYLGMFATELPNSFNILTTQSSAASGSLLMVLEQQIAYATKVVQKCQRDGYKSVVVKKTAVDDFLKYTDSYFGRTVLTTNCKSWYKNGSTGDATIRTLWPGSGSHYFAALQHPRWEDFDWETVDEEGMDHSMSWLGNGCASHMDGAQVHLAMREYYQLAST